MLLFRLTPGGQPLRAGETIRLMTRDPADERGRGARGEQFFAICALPGCVGSLPAPGRGRMMPSPTAGISRMPQSRKTARFSLLTRRGIAS